METAAVATAALALAGLGLTAAPASAAALSGTSAELVGVVQYDPAVPEVAMVKARYRCYGEGAL